LYLQGEFTTHETSHEKVFSHSESRVLGIGDSDSYRNHLTVKKQIINRWNV